MKERTKEEVTYQETRNTSIKDDYLKDPDSIMGLLTSEEFKVFLIMLNANSPMTAQTLRIGYAGYLLQDKARKMAMDRILNPDTFTKEEISGQMILDRELSEWKKNTTGKKKIARLIDFLKFNGRSVPSYKKIKRILNDLNVIGLVLSRHTSYKSANEMWAISPDVRSAWMKKRDYWENKIKQVGWKDAYLNGYIRPHFDYYDLYQFILPKLIKESDANKQNTMFSKIFKIFE